MEPQITNDKPVKIKDPKKVERGKQLALISQAAKAKKRQERDEQSKQCAKNFTESEEQTDLKSLGLIGFVGVSVALGALYFKYAPNLQSSLKTNNTPANSVVEKKPKETTIKKNVLESFD